MHLLHHLFSGSMHTYIHIHIYSYSRLFGNTQTVDSTRDVYWWWNRTWTSFGKWLIQGVGFPSPQSGGWFSYPIHAGRDGVSWWRRGDRLPAAASECPSAPSMCWASACLHPSPCQPRTGNEHPWRAPPHRSTPPPLHLSSSADLLLPPAPQCIINSCFKWREKTNEWCDVYL